MALCGCGAIRQSKPHEAIFANGVRPMSNTNEKTGQKLDQTLPSDIIIGKMRRDNHTGCLTRRGDGKPWIARWQYKGKIYTKSTRTTDKAVAKKILNMLTQPFLHKAEENVVQALQDITRIVSKSIAKPEIAITEIWKIYEAKQEWRDKQSQSKGNYERMIHKLECWMQKHGCRYMSDVTNEKALSFLKELADKIGIQTYNNYLTQYKLVWKTLLATKAYNIMADTWDGREKLTDNQKASDRRETFRPAEIKAILSSADDDMRLLILAGLYTGMRLEDCAGLRWSDLDMEHKQLRVKTQKRGVWVEMAIAPELYTALVEAKKTATGDYVNVRNAKSGNLGDRFGAILDKCGIVRNAKDEKGRLTIKKSFHSLRHTHASAYYAEGASMSDVARRIGDTEKTAEKYVHKGYGYTLTGAITQAVREALGWNLCKAA